MKDVAKPEMVKSEEAGIAGRKRPVERPPGALTIVYIMGYGRSGSTLLDVILGSHPEITSVGEISYLSRWLLENAFCACHSPIRECAFWSAVMREYAVALDGEDLSQCDVERGVESRQSLVRLLRRRVPDATAATYGRLQTAILASVGLVAGNQIIVDSSKSVRRTDGRPLALQNFTRFDVRVIHLVRDGRAVTWSALKGPGASDGVAYRRPLPRWLRGLLVITDWTATNMICLALSKRLRQGSVLRIRYEDLVRDPQLTLTRIGSFVGVDLSVVSETISAGQPLSPGHNVGGNRLRFASAVRLQEDREWRDRLPWIFRSLYWLIAWPLARKLGYGMDAG